MEVKPGMVAAQLWKARAGGSLVCSRSTRATLLNPVSKNKHKNAQRKISEFS